MCRRRQTPLLGWLFGFENEITQGAVAFDLQNDRRTRLCPAEFFAKVADVEPGTGYDREVRHVLACVRAGRTSADATLAEAAAVTRILMAEKHELAGRA